MDGFEADVVLAADGEIVAIHDPLLQIGTADLAGWAHEYPADILTQAHIRGGRGEPSDQRPLNIRQAGLGTPHMDGNTLVEVVNAGEGQTATPLMWLKTLDEAGCAPSARRCQIGARDGHQGGTP